MATEENSELVASVADLPAAEADVDSPTVPEQHETVERRDGVARLEDLGLLPTTGVPVHIGPPQLRRRSSRRVRRRRQLISLLILVVLVAAAGTVLVAVR